MLSDDLLPFDGPLLWYPPAMPERIRAAVVCVLLRPFYWMTPARWYNVGGKRERFLFWVWSRCYWYAEIRAARA